MKQIINGKMYNTNTAEEIAERESGYPGDFRHVRESLYQKKTGEFFLCGEGGPLTSYREAMMDGHSWCGGSGIIPLTEDGAKEWVEKYASTSTYVDLFGEPEE